MFERVLVIETSGKVGQAAVADPSGVRASATLSEIRRHARDLAMRIKELIDGQRWSPRDLTSVIVDLGPGSFTGLRVGLASAKAMTYALGVPLFGVPAFEAIASAAPNDVRQLEIIADALQGNVYCQSFQRDADEKWTASAALAIRPFEEWRRDLMPGAVAAGPGVAIFRDRLPEGTRAMDGSRNEPDAAGLLRVAQASPARWQVDPWAIEPIYLRGSSAEEKRKASASAQAQR